MSKFISLINNVLSVFYPDLCVGCQQVLQQNEKHLCLDCMLHLPETNYHLDHSNPLTLLFAGRVPVKETASLLFFRKGTHAQHILHSLKYRGNKEIGAFLGEYYGRKLAESPLYQDIDLIIPIPLHPKKLKKRGYNQSEWIAMGLSKGLGLPYSNDFLVRATSTQPQTPKHRFSRWQNVKDVFQAADVEELAGKHVLVCDDVLTTGATTEAAIRKLLEVPGVRVSVVTLATAK
jgi:ComF family protein